MRPGRRLLLWSAVLLGLPLGLYLVEPRLALYLALAYLAPFAGLALLAAFIVPFVVLHVRYDVWRERAQAWERVERERQVAVDRMLEEEKARLSLEAEIESLAAWDGYVPDGLLSDERR